MPTDYHSLIKKIEKANFDVEQWNNLTSIVATIKSSRINAAERKNKVDTETKNLIDKYNAKKDDLESKKNEFETFYKAKKKSVEAVVGARKDKALGIIRDFDDGVKDIQKKLNDLKDEFFSARDDFEAARADWNQANADLLSAKNFQAYIENELTNLEKLTNLLTAEIPGDKNWHNRAIFHLEHFRQSRNNIKINKASEFEKEIKNSWKEVQNKRISMEDKEIALGEAKKSMDEKEKEYMDAITNREARILEQIDQLT